MVKNYIPDKGDIVFLDFDSQSGREQAGRRPAVVISPKSYNAAAGLAVFCAITSKIKNYPFEVPLSDNLQTKGVVLADHIKNFDWKARHVLFKEKLSQKNLQDIFSKVELLLFH